MQDLLSPQAAHQDDAFFGSLPLGYVAVRRDGVITQTNRAAAAALGYEPGDLVGRMAAEFPFDEANRRIFLDQMAQRSTGLAGSYALQLRARSNDRLRVACFAVPQFDASGIYWGSRGIVVPFAQVNQLALQPGEGTEELLRRTLGAGPVMDRVGGGQAFTGTFTPGGFAHENNALMATLLPKLTKRERDVVSLLLMGLRVNGVAERLDLSHYTVRNHLKRIFRKAGVNSQGQLLLKLNAAP